MIRPGSTMKLKMPPGVAHLSLVKRIRPGTVGPMKGVPFKTERPFLDFIIDGVSLYEAAAKDRDLVSAIWTEPPVPEERIKAIRRLLATEPGDASDGRASLYVCPECGDLGCGAITIRIERTSEEILWRDFGYENSYEAHVERGPFASLGPYRFGRVEYTARLEALLQG